MNDLNQKVGLIEILQKHAFYLGKCNAEFGNFKLGFFFGCDASLFPHFFPKWGQDTYGRKEPNRENLSGRVKNIVLPAAPISTPSLFKTFPGPGKLKAKQGGNAVT